MTYGHYTGTSVAIPSTCYSSEGTTTFKSNPEKGAGYYGVSGALHTVTYTVTPNFVGTVTSQATLATAPVEKDWFNITGSTVIYPDLPMPISSTTTNLVNFTGNFLWIRAVVQRSVMQPNGSVQIVNYNF
jgi:hypothetical protein